MRTSECKKSITSIKQANIFPHQTLVSREMRNETAGHKSGVVWLTGLSGSGKSTIATGVEQQLFNKHRAVYLLDGDTLRSGLNSDLNFSVRSREENLRRAGEVASLFAEAGNIVIASFVSPHRNSRQFVRNIVRENFFLIYVRADIEDCISRDPKGLYQKALNGGIENFTGIGQSYEEPVDADMVLDTSTNDVGACQRQLKEFIESKFLPSKS